MNGALVAEGPVESPGPPLSRVRTFLFAALACSWFTEMVFLGFQSGAKEWTHLWQVTPPADPRLLTALYITWAVAAPAKGALCVMAVLGVRSRTPSVRTALFTSMALVPPLNLAFPFRQQGFLPQPVAVATTLTVILWGSFLLFRERSQAGEPRETRASGQSGRSRFEIIQGGWFAVSSAALTLIALLFIFWPGAALSLSLPCLSSVVDAHEGELSGLIHSAMASGTHLLALAMASWIATANGRGNPELRRAVALALTVHAGLFAVFPLRQIAEGFGGACASSSLLIVFLPLFACWVLYAIADARRKAIA